MVSKELKQIIDPDNKCCCEYHLSHKCKEWAFSKGFEIVVLSSAIRIYRNKFEVYFIDTKLYDLVDFFKACEWILKEGN